MGALRSHDQEQRATDNSLERAPPPEATMTRRRLPIGIQTFRRIREEGCYYVDKTAYIRRLLDEGTHYFLSRSRCFGKSLFLDTCKELFEGSEALFEGLAIHDRWDWSVRNPVVRLSFGAGHFKRPDDLRMGVMDLLEMQESQAGITARHESAPARLAHVIRTLHERTGQRVAVLVDEYDKPILDALDVPEVARANRDFLRGLYAVIKDCDADIHFSFITGVSKFSKVSLFSGLNNLKDITLAPRYATICGYTESDLDTVFSPELSSLDRNMIREWYNGYGWRGEERVYNPYDILLLFDEREFGAWWFETGTPAFLVETLFRRRVSALSLDGMLGSAELLSTFDVDNMPTEALLLQTGYLTILRAEPRGGEMFYRLGYPNLEVRQSLNRSLLNHMTGDPSGRSSNNAYAGMALGRWTLHGAGGVLARAHNGREDDGDDPRSVDGNRHWNRDSHCDRSIQSAASDRASGGAESGARGNRPAPRTHGEARRTAGGPARGHYRPQGRLSSTTQAHHPAHRRNNRYAGFSVSSRYS